MLNTIKITTAIICLTVLLANASTSDLIDKAYQQLNSGNTNAVLQISNDILKSDPKNPDARFIKGLGLTQKGEITQAINVFKSLTVDYPNNPESWNNLASLYARQEKYHQARDALISAINTHPSYATAYENLGSIYSKMAVIAYNRALDVEQSNQKKPVNVQLALINRFSNSTGAPIKSTIQIPASFIEPVSKKLPDIEEKSIFSYDKEKDQILAVLHGWSKAWSAQKPKDYLMYYAPDFQTPGGMPRKIWEKRRHERLLKPNFIKVKVEQTEIVFINDTTARLRFLQDYHSNHFRDKIKKTFIMQKVNGNWRISKESIGG
ncbi:MAG: tetratricopeptide repeat protein [Gammaproteobacteria bacterium]|nr:tetratricopeptide repeat protein [Gammaproteobacteria bacterium]